VLFPEPEGPTIAVVYFAFILNDTFSKMFFVLTRAVGYLKVAFTNSMDSLRLNSVMLSFLSLIIGSLSMTSKTILPTSLALTMPFKLG
jgi:hypothetical protein